MSPLLYNSAIWPPPDGSFMGGLQRPYAQSIVKNIDRGSVSGMSYRIDGESVYTDGKPRSLYFIQIDSWDYTIRNDSVETPILSFAYIGLGLMHMPLDKAVQNIRVFDKPFRRGYRAPDKALRAAAYLMRQIAQGNVPDAQRVLGAYKLLPANPLIPGFFQNSFSFANGLLKDGN